MAGIPLEVSKSIGETYQPSVKRRKRRHGFLSRIRTKEGRDIIQRRIRAGRKHISI